MIQLIKNDKLTTITLNRPEKANALTSEILSDLIQAVHESRTQNAVILTGVGKVFSAGADLEEAKNGLALSPLWEELSNSIAELPGLTIAALNGTVAGGAFGMVLACDLRFAVPSAKFFYPVMRLGFLPQPSDPIRLKSIAGPSMAKRILMASEKIKAEEAKLCGLVDKISPAGDLINDAHEAASAALTAEIRHVSAIKSMI